ncbi:hypothetical protein F511_29580 [Dorcoceras hygrometricum]|uniref:Uncharacterized protein n=1 Tax=Dorcoceras hygrometricum TaxID=472368 RepID=A0A2Z7CZV7_9LAMI|nr:hypothetical protein F511_29580 [Dorcoceras hygrometricum]
MEKGNSGQRELQPTRTKLSLRFTGLRPGQGASTPRFLTGDRLPGPSSSGDRTTEAGPRAENQNDVSPCILVHTDSQSSLTRFCTCGTIATKSRPRHEQRELQPTRTKLSLRFTGLRPGQGASTPRFLTGDRLPGPSSSGDRTTEAGPRAENQNDVSPCILVHTDSQSSLTRFCTCGTIATKSRPRHEQRELQPTRTKLSLRFTGLRPGQGASTPRFLTGDRLPGPSSSGDRTTEAGPRAENQNDVSPCILVHTDSQSSLTRFCTCGTIATKSRPRHEQRELQPTRTKLSLRFTGLRPGQGASTPRFLTGDRLPGPSSSGDRTTEAGPRAENQNDVSPCILVHTDSQSSLTRFCTCGTIATKSRPRHEMATLIPQILSKISVSIHVEILHKLYQISCTRQELQQTEMAPSVPRTRDAAALRMKQISLDNHSRTIRRLRAKLAIERRETSAIKEGLDKKLVVEAKKEHKTNQVALEASHKTIAGLTEIGLCMSNKIKIMKAKKRHARESHMECHHKLQARIQEAEDTIQEHLIIEALVEEKTSLLQTIQGLQEDNGAPDPFDDEWEEEPEEDPEE